MRLSIQGIDELRICGNHVAFSIGPVQEVVTEILDSSEGDFATCLVFLSHRIDVHRTSSFVVWHSRECKLLNSLCRTVDDTRNNHITNGNVLVVCTV